MHSSSVPLNPYAYPIPTELQESNEELGDTMVNAGANFSTPIVNKVGAIHNNRLRSLAKAFLLDPRSPSDGILRTPIVIKNNNAVDLNASLQNACLVSEEDDMSKTFDFDDETFRASFEQALSRISFDTEPSVRAAAALETHFESGKLNDLQSSCDPRSPSVGIERTPLVLESVSRPVVVVAAAAEDLAIQPATARDDKADNIEAVTEPVSENLIDVNVEIKADENMVFIDDDQQVAFDSPTASESNTTNPQPVLRTPLSCLANRPRPRLGEKVGNSPFNKQGKLALGSGSKIGSDGLPKARNKTMLFEPRKLIR